MRDPQLVDTPNLYPGQCVDGRQDGPVVCTFYEPPGYGMVYLSRTMIRDAARLVPGLADELAVENKYVSGAEHDAVVASLRDQLDSALRDVAELERISLAIVREAAHERTAKAA